MCEFVVSSAYHINTLTLVLEPVRRGCRTEVGTISPPSVFLPLYKAVWMFGIDVSTMRYIGEFGAYGSHLVEYGPSHRDHGGRMFHVCSALERALPRHCRPHGVVRVEKRFD